MSRKDFITIEELKAKLREAIAKDNLSYDVDLIMGEIGKRVSAGAFNTFDETHLVKIEGYKILAVRGKDLQGEVNFNHVFFFEGPSVFSGRHFPLENQ